MKQIIQIISGIHLHYLRDYFLSIASSHKDNDYYGEHWHIQLIPQEDQIHGILTLPRTYIIFEGNEDIIKYQVNAYRMMFLSAGG